MPAVTLRETEENINRRRPMAFNSMIPDQIDPFQKHAYKNHSQKWRRLISPRILSMSLAVALTLLTVIPLLREQASAQGITTGSISGIVADTSGAVIPGATITVTAKATNVTLKMTSGGD